MVPNCPLSLPEVSNNSSLSVLISCSWSISPQIDLPLQIWKNAYRRSVNGHCGAETVTRGETPFELRSHQKKNQVPSSSPRCRRSVWSFWQSDGFSLSLSRLHRSFSNRSPLLQTGLINLSKSDSLIVCLLIIYSYVSKQNNNMQGPVSPTPPHLHHHQPTSSILIQSWQILYHKNRLISLSPNTLTAPWYFHSP
jgi:hypothetical protein